MLTTAGMVGVVNSAVIGACAGLAIQTLGIGSFAVALIGGSITGVVTLVLHRRHHRRARDAYRPEASTGRNRPPDGRTLKRPESARGWDSADPGSVGSFLQDIGHVWRVRGAQRPAVDGRSFARLGAGLSPRRFGFELGWRQITEALVQSAVVEWAEILHDSASTASSSCDRIRQMRSAISSGAEAAPRSSSANALS